MKTVLLRNKDVSLWVKTTKSCAPAGVLAEALAPVAKALVDYFPAAGHMPIQNQNL